MQRQQFINWLTENGRDERTAETRAANCVTVCQYEGDLDTLFDEDECADLLDRLSYSKQDQRLALRARHRIPINGDVYNGTATYRAAVNLYVKFRKNEILGDVQVAGRARGNRIDWPDWGCPGDEESLALAKATTPFVKFLSPEVVAKIVEDNERIKEILLRGFRDKGVDCSSYIWDKSSCCFPGVRRYSGGDEIEMFRRGQRALNGEKGDVANALNALALDDNTMPKQIWSFVLRGRKCDNTNPDGYKLAHLVDHKGNGRIAEEFIFDDGYDPRHPLYGLFTSATNAVYISGGLMDPTDFNGLVRNLLFRKAFDLYSDVCNLVPEYMHLIRNEDPRWALTEFNWAEPVGTTEYVDQFLEFRKNELTRMFQIDF